jgi:hypothetical protein
VKYFANPAVTHSVVPIGTIYDKRDELANVELPEHIFGGILVLSLYVCHFCTILTYKQQFQFQFDFNIAFNTEVYALMESVNVNLLICTFACLLKKNFKKPCRHSPLGTLDARVVLEEPRQVLHEVLRVRTSRPLTGQRTILTVKADIYTRKQSQYVTIEDINNHKSKLISTQGNKIDTQCIIIPFKLASNIYV